MFDIMLGSFLSISLWFSIVFVVFTTKISFSFIEEAEFLAEQINNTAIKYQESPSNESLLAEFNQPKECWTDEFNSHLYRISADLTTSQREQLIKDLYDIEPSEDYSKVLRK
jgi:hypothetical protein